VSTPQIKAILDRLRNAREKAGKTPEDVEDELILGPGWVERFESGGAVHVKASFAERRDDDVPLSRALMEAGFASIFWTMDSKSGPSERPVNRGELGALLGEGDDERSQKRKDFEVYGSFSACFSYNRNTKPTPIEQEAAARIHRVDFSNPEGDAFTTFVCEAWRAYQATNS
jgi:hypothetical protein